MTTDATLPTNELENKEANDIDYKNLNFRSGDHILFFIFRESGSLVSLYLKLLNGYIRIIKAESDLKQFNAEIKRPEKKLKKKTIQNE